MGISANDFSVKLEGQRDRVKDIVFCIDCGAEGLTWDSRLTVNVGDIRWD